MTRTPWIMLVVCLLGSGPAAAQRDPFWPIGYQPTEGQPRPRPTPVAEVDSAPRQVRSLTDEELRQLAREESERIKRELRIKGTMKAGDRIYIYIQDKWVTRGDSFNVEVLGKPYRLQILELTSENIELEAHRVAE